VANTTSMSPILTFLNCASIATLASFIVCTCGWCEVGSQNAAMGSGMLVASTMVTVSCMDWVII